MYVCLCLCVSGGLECLPRIILLKHFSSWSPMCHESTRLQKELPRGNEVMPPHGHRWLADQNRRRQSLERWEWRIPSENRERTRIRWVLSFGLSWFLRFSCILCLGSMWNPKSPALTCIGAYTIWVEFLSLITLKILVNIMWM